jgi:hypothetical protein
VYLDRYLNIDLLVAAQATSSSNANAAACSMILREAIGNCNYPWQDEGSNLPDTILAVFQKTGIPIKDSATGYEFRELDLLAAVDYVYRFSVS